MLIVAKILREMGEGDMSKRGQAVAWLNAEFVKPTSAPLDQLIARLALEGDEASSKALDREVDLICGQPSKIRGGLSPQWHCLAVTLFIANNEPSQGPASTTGASLVASIAAQMNIPISCVRCPLVPFTPEQFFGLSPHDLAELCKRTKGTCDQMERVPFFLPDLNISPSAEAVVVLMGLHVTPAIFQNLVQYHLTPQALEHGAEVLKPSAEITYLHVGLPWSMSSTALHCLEVHQFMQTLHSIQEKLKAGSILNVVAAYVEESSALCHSLRLSVLSEDGCLRGGHAFCDLHEPSVFLMKLDVMLNELGFAPIRQVTQTYFSVETGGSSENGSFFVPGRGWQQVTVI
jgi:hypothetical protein